MKPRIDWARRAVKTLPGALATVYSCPFCQYHLAMRKGIPGVGRGYGLGMGGKLSSEVAAHIRAEHPKQLQLFIEKEQGK